MTKPNSITQDLDTKEAEATNPLVRFYIREIRKHATAIDPNCEASSNAFNEAVNSAQKAAQLESMRRAGIAIPSPDRQVVHDTWPKPQAEAMADAAKPWLRVDPRDPSPKQPWYTPARYFARQLVVDDSTLLSKRDILAAKVSKSLTTAGIYKRGGTKALSADTVKKALSNVVFG